MKDINRRDFIKYGTALGAAAGTGLFSGLTFASDKPLKIGVGLIGEVGEIGWSKRQAVAVDAVRQKFGNKVDITVVDHTDTFQEAVHIFRTLAANGNKLVFGTSFSHFQPLLKVAPNFPDTVFECCSGLSTLPNLGVFEAKYFQGSYVAGATAGHMSKTGKIGFIGPFPVPDIVAPANSLLLGAQSVNPDAECHIIFLDSWNDPGKERQAAKALASQGCDVICPMTDTPSGVQYAGAHDIWSIGYASDMSRFASGTQLTAFTLHWGSEYIRNTKEVLTGTWEPENRWDGLSTGVVQLAPFNKNIPDKTVAEMKQLISDIESGAVHPFKGPIKDQSGKLRIAEGAVPTEDVVRSMTWLVSGMIGNA